MATSKRFDASAFVRRHGVVLASGKGPVPNVADAIAGEPIRGSWWAHAKGPAIFEALTRLGDDADVCCCRLVEGKITLVHRRLWPALVRLKNEIGEHRLAAVRQEHMASGAHHKLTRPIAEWAPSRVVRDAAQPGVKEARALLGDWYAPAKQPSTKTKAKTRAKTKRAAKAAPRPRVTAG